MYRYIKLSKRWHQHQSQLVVYTTITSTSIYNSGLSVFFVTVADAQLVTSELPGLVKVAIGLFGLSCKPASLAYRILLSMPLAETVA